MLRGERERVGTGEIGRVRTTMGVGRGLEKVGRKRTYYVLYINETRLMKLRDTSLDRVL